MPIFSFWIKRKAFGGDVHGKCPKIFHLYTNGIKCISNVFEIYTQIRRILWNKIFGPQSMTKKFFLYNSRPCDCFGVLLLNIILKSI